MELMFKHVSPISLGAKRGSMARCGRIMGHLHSHAVGADKIKIQTGCKPFVCKVFEIYQIDDSSQTD
ncbi:hypothetical protein YQE_12966, partial [Dendroctonus ponderosae]